MATVVLYHFSSLSSFSEVAHQVKCVRGKPHHLAENGTGRSNIKNTFLKWTKEIPLRSTSSWPPCGSRLTNLENHKSQWKDPAEADAAR